MSNRSPLVIDAGRVKELPSADDQTLGGGLVKNSVDASNTKVIPSGYQIIVYSKYTVDGTLDVQGDLVIL